MAANFDGSAFRCERARAVNLATAVIFCLGPVTKPASYRFQLSLGRERQLSHRKGSSFSTERHHPFAFGRIKEHYFRRDFTLAPPPNSPDRSSDEESTGSVVTASTGFSPFAITGVVGSSANSFQPEPIFGPCG